MFDERVGVKHHLDIGEYAKCYACRTPLTKVDKLDSNYVEGVSCAKCYNTTTPEQKLKYEERQRQIALAKERGVIHLGKEISHVPINP